MKEVTFVFTVAEANVVLDAVSKLPYDVVADLVAKMLMQAQEQAAE